MTRELIVSCYKCGVAVSAGDDLSEEVARLRAEVEEMDAEAEKAAQDFAAERAARWHEQQRAEDAESSAARLREALRAAAKSLEWIAARRASPAEQMTTLDVLMEIRQYANSRATTARAALSEAAPEGRKP